MWSKNNKIDYRLDNVIMDTLNKPENRKRLGVLCSELLNELLNYDVTSIQPSQKTISPEDTLGMVKDYVRKKLDFDDVDNIIFQKIPAERRSNRNGDLARGIYAYIRSIPGLGSIEYNPDVPYHKLSNSLVHEIGHAYQHSTNPTFYDEKFDDVKIFLEAHAISLENELAGEISAKTGDARYEYDAKVSLLGNAMLVYGLLLLNNSELDRSKSFVNPEDDPVMEIIKNDSILKSYNAALGDNKINCVVGGDQSHWYGSALALLMKDKGGFDTLDKTWIEGSSNPLKK